MHSKPSTPPRPTRERRVTLTDIAVGCGLSRAAVSLVVNELANPFFAVSGGVSA